MKFGTRSLIDGNNHSNPRMENRTSYNGRTSNRRMLCSHVFVDRSSPRSNRRPLASLTP